MTAGEKRATELLVDRVTEGLGLELESELAGLLAMHPDLDPESFELAAAAVDLALDVPEEPLPAALRQRLSQQARRFYAGGAPSAPAAEGGKVLAFRSRSDAAEKPRDATRWLGWMAAAASLILAVIGWWPAGEQLPVSAELDPAAARAELVASAADLIELKWTATEDPAARGTSGDVVWSTARQSGFMRFRGLPVNDPAVEQYQLWIFDAEQDERYPVDGGVFDVPSQGEVVVPIAAKLRVAKPTLFAVTVEKPGGVVVSSRERLPLVASVG